MWDALGEVSVINTFQFDSAEGSKAAKQLKPRTILEMADANGSRIGPYILYRFINGVCAKGKIPGNFWKRAG